MKEYIKGVAVQFSAIFLAALGAGFIAFISSLMSSMGATCSPEVDPTQAGALGALFKGVHSAILAGHGRIG
jgi:hypothetical protein